VDSWAACLGKAKRNEVVTVVAQLVPSQNRFVVLFSHIN